MKIRSLADWFNCLTELWHSIVNHTFILAPLVVAGTTCISGCNFTKEKNQKTYETVQANERYDTETARRQHAKGLKQLEKSLHGGPGRLADAEVHFQKALVADITYGPVHNSLGIVYMRQRKYYTAAWEFEYAAKLMPEHFEPLYNLGLLYETADKLENAISYYEQAIALAPRNPVVIGNLAKAKLRDGRDFEEVRPLLQELVFHDNRCDWVTWAKDLMGTKPVQMVSAESTTSAADSSAPASQPMSVHDAAPSDESAPPPLQMSPPQAPAPDPSGVSDPPAPSRDLLLRE